MQDAFAYCAALVREADHDRYIAALFAPAERRNGLLALYAFNVEIARVREAAREAMPGEIRLQWWREVVSGERAGEAAANPVAAALLDVVARHGLPAARLAALIDAHSFDLYDDPMARLVDLETYAGATGGALASLAAQILAAIDAEQAAVPAGIAYALTGLVRTFPIHAERGQLYLSVELFERHGVQAQDVFAGRSSPGLNSALAELRNVARQHLAAAAPHIMALPADALPAVLPVALVRPSLDRLDRCDAFAPAELSPLRRQWLIWRAARNPVRIAR